MKPVSVQKVSAILRKATFPKAERLTGGRWTDGVSIAKDPYERPVVRLHYPASQLPMMLVSAKEALRQGGIEFFVGDGLSLICTGIKEER